MEDELTREEWLKIIFKDKDVIPATKDMFKVYSELQPKITDKIDRKLMIERIKYEIEKLSNMRHSDKKHHDVILWMHIREAERRLLNDLQSSDQ